MQVFEVEDWMAVRPNCAYIIPPDRGMDFLNGELQLPEPRRAQRGCKVVRTEFGPEFGPCFQFSFLLKKPCAG